LSVERQGLRVIDNHAHFPFPGAWGGHRAWKPQLQEYVKARNARMALEWDFPSSPSEREEPQSWEEIADRWLAELERYQIRRILFVTGGGNANLANVIARHPDRFMGMAHHAIWEENGLDELKRGIEEYGFKGLKLLGPRVPISFDDERLVPIWEYLAGRGLPVLCHFGPLGTAGGVVYHQNMSPLVIANVARNWPEITWIIPHFGCGYMQDLLWLCWSVPNVCVDTSGSNQWMRWVPYEMTTEKAFAKYYETIGPERIIFGTDSSWFPRGFSYRYLQDQLRDLRHLNWKQEEIQLVFGGNAARVMKVDL
jgi:uncharacterized protein